MGGLRGVRGTRENFVLQHSTPTLGHIQPSIERDNEVHQLGTKRQWRKVDKLSLFNCEINN